MINYPRLLPALAGSTLMAALGGLMAPVVLDGQATQPFDVAELFLELNDTDGDLGLHAEIDGDEWTNLEIEGPGQHQLLDITSKSRLRTQGLTQLAFESAEPTFDELLPAEFFKRCPAGVYRVEGRAHQGDAFESLVALSHVLAAPPASVVNGIPAADSCEAPVLPVVMPPVIIDWNPVTASHPDIGTPGPVTISRYQFFVEQGATKLGVDLAPTVTAFEIPLSITAAGGVFKYEIIARTSTGNNTAAETCFRVN